MNACELKKRISKLPLDVVMNHIIPFTYSTFPRRLLNDIKSYYKDFEILENIYHIEFNDTILLHDLLRFCNHNIAPVYGLHEKYENILRRNYYLSGKSNTFIMEYIFFHFHASLLVNKVRKIRFLWGLFTPKERTRFINHLLFYLEN